jgi:hypothetical protein
MNSPSNSGSLLRLFNSEFFSPYLALYYLLKLRENEGVVSYLINALHVFPAEEFVLFIPQLCSICRQLQLDAFDSWIAKLCGSDMTFAVRWLWYCHASAGAWTAPHLPELLRDCRDSYVAGFLPTNQHFYLDYQHFISVSLVDISLKAAKEAPGERLAFVQRELLLCLQAKSPEKMPLFVGMDRERKKTKKKTKEPPIVTAWNIDKTLVLQSRWCPFVLGLEFDEKRVEGGGEGEEEEEEDVHDDDDEEEQGNEPGAPCRLFVDSIPTPSMIVKGGEDLRQEALAMQLLCELNRIWQEASLPLHNMTYDIVPCHMAGGFIQTVKEVMSLHHLKAANGLSAAASMMDVFEKLFGERGSAPFVAAQERFVKSAAAVSLSTYLLQVKDRHNANFLLRASGELGQIDFGFILGQSPRLQWESAPFKLTSEWISVMGGPNSDWHNYFSVLFLQGLLAVRKDHERLCWMIESLSGMGIPCIQNKGADVVGAFKDRLKLSMTEDQVVAYVRTLTQSALDAFSTRQYDQFQYYVNGIL